MKWNTTSGNAVKTGTRNAAPLWETGYQQNYFPYTQQYYQPPIIISPGGQNYWDPQGHKWKPLPNGNGNSWGNFLFGFILAIALLGSLFLIAQ